MTYKVRSELLRHVIDIQDTDFHPHVDVVYGLLVTSVQNDESTYPVQQPTPFLPVTCFQIYFWSISSWLPSLYAVQLVLVLELIK